MSENIDIFKSDTKPPKVMIKELPSSLMKDSSDRHDDFGRDVIRASQTSALDAEKNGNNDPEFAIKIYTLCLQKRYFT